MRAVIKICIDCKICTIKRKAPQHGNLQGVEKKFRQFLFSFLRRHAEPKREQRLLRTPISSLCSACTACIRPASISVTSSQSSAMSSGLWLARNIVLPALVVQMARRTVKTPSWSRPFIGSSHEYRRPSIIAWLPSRCFIQGNISTPAFLSYGLFDILIAVSISAFLLSSLIPASRLRFL